MLLNLTGKKILVTGIANNRSIAWGIAQQLSKAGAELGITYLPDDKGRFESKVRELTEPLNPSLFLPLDVQNPAQIEEIFKNIKDNWGQIDGLVHCLAFAGRDELIGDYSATTSEGFDRALNISAYSLAPLCKAAKPLFSDGAGVVSLTYLGSERAIPNYNVMGVAKAALEASVRYLAVDLGEKNIRVNAISAGPIKTLAASGIGDFRFILKWNELNAPLKRNVNQQDVGNSALYLLSDLGSAVTGEIQHVDCGYHTVGMVAVDESESVSELLGEFTNSKK